MSGDADEPIPGADEGNYPPVFEDSYPMINSNLLPPSVTDAGRDEAKRFSGTVPSLPGEKRAESYSGGPERVLPGIYRKPLSRADEAAHAIGTGRRVQSEKRTERILSQTDRNEAGFISDKDYPAVVDLSFGSAAPAERALDKALKPDVDPGLNQVSPPAVPGIGSRGTTVDRSSLTGGYTRQEQVHPGMQGHDAVEVSRKEQVQSISEIARRHREKQAGRETYPTEPPRDSDVRVSPEKRFQSISDIARLHREKQAGRESRQPELPASREGNVTPGKRVRRISEITEYRQEEANREGRPVDVQKAGEGSVVHGPAVKPEGESEIATPEQHDKPSAPASPDIGKSDEAETRVIEIINGQTKSDKEEKSEYGSLPPDMPVAAKPDILKDTSKRPGLPMIQRTADFIKRAGTRISPEQKAGAAGRTPAPMPGRIVHVESRKTVGFQSQEKAIDVYPASAAEDSETGYMSEEIPFIEQRPDTGDAEQSGGNVKRTSSEHKGRIPLYREPSLMPTPPLGSIQRREVENAGGNEGATSFVAPIDGDEGSGWQYNRHRAPSGPGYQHAPLPIPGMSADSFIQPERDSGKIFREELQTDFPGRADVMPELVHPGKQVVSEPGIEQIDRADEGQRDVAAEPEIENRESGGEETAAQDIDAIARDVYRVLRRRLIRERERSLGVI